MGLNILITGAAGYIGGTILADFLARTDGPIKDSTIHAAVRTSEQVKALAKLGVDVIQVDLTDTNAVLKIVIDNNIDLVVHTATSMDARQPSNLINALGERRKLTGENKHFIHTSVTTMYSEEGGWPFGEIKDSENVYEKEVQVEKGNPVRDLNIFVVDHAKTLGVTSFIVPVPFVYGIGTGAWRKLCVHIPSHIRAFMKHKTVYVFDKEGNPPAAHVTDVASFYGVLVEHILNNTQIPNGKDGYYFIIAHRSPWWAVMQRVGDAMYARGLVTEAKTHTWPSYEMAAEALGLPLMYIRAMETSSGEMVGVNARQLGWQPKWDQEKYLNSMDEEVRGVLELDDMKPTVLQSLLVSEQAA